jgi:hypothetical protein
MMVRPLLFCGLLLSSANAAAAGFDPFDFFSGSTRGDGTLDVALEGREPFKVESRGRPDGHGGFVLDQVVRQGSKPPKQRRWFLRQVAPGSFVGSISDAPGPVKGQVVGQSLVLRYPVKGGMKAEQVLTPQADGKTVRNSIIVRKLGFIVAKVHEIIRKLD